MHRWLTLAIVYLLATQAFAGEIRILPAAVVLSGPHASQRLLAVRETGGQINADVTPKTTFTSSNPGMISIDAQGVVRARADGEATITALHGTDRATVKVRAEKTGEPFAWSFRNHIIPALTKIGCNSGACHGALAGKGGLKLSLRGYAPETDHFVLTRQAKGRRINPKEPAHSLMLLKPTMAVAHGGGLKIEVGSVDYQVLADWIAAGAPGPTAGDVRIQRLEVFPSAAVLKPGNGMAMIVRARYSDGHAEDVTQWCKFSSTEDLVASVDERGQVKVSGYGEAAITVWYSNMVAVSRISSPLAQVVADRVFQTAPRHNYIDNLVLKKLAGLHIPPSPTCSDREFIRRAYLDAAGIMPTPAEVQTFLTDARADKRARLIDTLSERPEFADYWAYKWSDLLLISSRKLSQPAMYAFYQFVRQSVADNKPWDQFAREIITARGSNLQNGAANFYVLHKDVSDLTETTAVTFMGMSVTCCRCHNHPLEKWTQDQYWSLANLFARVAIKNGDRGGEITVQSLPAGDVLHPRRGYAMSPAPLDGKPLSLESGGDRREYFAAWLTAADNPYFARALVNRVWRNFLGRGLVEAEDDLRQTNPPSNAELFDALAKDFVSQRYNVKHLIRTIMNSAAYQRSSVPLPENRSDDRFYSHYLIRRLPAEVILDAYAQITGVPTGFTSRQLGPTGGVAATSDYPPGTRALQLPDTQLVSQFLDAFGRPERGQPCSCERQQESSVTQALALNNGQALNDRLRDKKSRVESWLKEKLSDREAIQRVFELALCRAPSKVEEERFIRLMAAAAREPSSGRREVIEDLFWAVLTGREFLFNR